MAQHDKIFKLYFKDPAVMQSLLRGLWTRIGLPKSWFPFLDIDKLIPLSTVLVSPALRELVADSAWFVPFRGPLGEANGKKRGIAIHQEFQSTQDPTMPWRMEEYGIDIRADLRRSGFTPEGYLTPVVSIVNFNGWPRWAIPLHTAEMYPIIGQVPVSQVIGSWRYLLLDMCAMDLNDLPDGELISCIIRQQTATEGWQVWDVLHDVYRLIPGRKNRELRSVFYLAAVNSPRIPGDVKFPLFDDFESTHNEGGNVTTLLEHNMEIWHNKVVGQGRAEGRAEGLVEGLVEGERKMLLRQATSLFGADIAERLAALLSRINDPERIARAGETLVKCDTGEEFLSRVGRDLG